MPLASMKFAPLTLALSLSVLVAGCVDAEQNTQGAAYPEAVGSDGPEQVAQPGSLAMGQSMNGGGSLNMAPASAGEPQDPGEVAIGGDPNEYADTDPSALSDFKPALEPYGTWEEDPTYGDVWVPSASVVGDDFAPYVTGGHWAYDDDYLWVSDYAWGWAPFHYGRWAYLGAPGWGWIPGRTYAGSWTTWRYGAGYDYVGWAPLPPTWYWRGGYAVGIGVVPPAPYVFCGTNNLFATNVGAHIVTGSAVGAIAARTQPYVPTGGLGGHTLAHPSVSGPPPTTTLHIPANEVAHAPAGDRGIMRAQQFAHPSSAQVAGAHAPARFGGAAVAGRYAGGMPGGAVAGHALLPRGGAMPAYGRPAQLPTRIGGEGAYGEGRSYSGYGGSFSSGRAYYGGAPAFHGGGSTYVGGGGYRGGGVSAPPASHYSGGSSFSGGHSGGGGRGGGHGGGHR